MKRLAAITVLITMICPVTSRAIIGVSIGGKVGYANYKGDILPSSGDVGDAVTYGAVLEIGTLPVVDVELHANYFAKDFLYAYDVAGVPVSGEFEFRDISLHALVKKNLIALPASPISLYVGGGIGWHLINTEVAKGAASVNPSQADNPFSLFSNNAKVGADGMVGVKIAPPVFPLAIYGEGRFGRIFTDEPINTTTIGAGLMLRF
ncbi:MAG: outer membrane beta-barrel protein [Candidatus Krumholzibacteria bacterium]|nr:outer membrane beta-barrel protein [Candidatus Krumholzibacteria bacterium]